MGRPKKNQAKASEDHQLCCCLSPRISIANVVAWKKKPEAIERSNFWIETNAVALIPLSHGHYVNVTASVFRPSYLTLIGGVSWSCHILCHYSAGTRVSPLSFDCAWGTRIEFEWHRTRSWLKLPCSNARSRLSSIQIDSIAIESARVTGVLLLFKSIFWTETCCIPLTLRTKRLVCKTSIYSHVLSTALLFVYSTQSVSCTQCHAMAVMFCTV